MTKFNEQCAQAKQGKCSCCNKQGFQVVNKEHGVICAPCLMVKVTAK